MTTAVRTIGREGSMWFKVDDGFHSHSKALLTPLEAIGLWTIAGSWSGANLTDGWIPEHVVPTLARGDLELPKHLLSSGLWVASKQGGYMFHEWAHDADGTKRNLTAQEVRAMRSKRIAAGRKGGVNSGKSRRSKAEAKAQAGASRLVEAKTNPDQTYIRDKEQTPTESVGPAPDEAKSKQVLQSESDLNRQAQELAKAYCDQVPLSKFPAVLSIAKRALKSGRYGTGEIHDAFLRLARENRSVTIDALRYELDGFPSRQSSEAPTDAAIKRFAREQASKLGPEHREIEGA